MGKSESPSKGWSTDFRGCDLLISLIGPVADLQSALGGQSLPGFFRVGQHDERESGVRRALLEPGLFDRVLPVPGALWALRTLTSKSMRVTLIAPGHTAFAPCRQGMYDWVDEHLGTRWAEEMIIVSDPTRVRGDRLLTSYVSVETSDCTWERVLMDAPHNAREKGIRMRDWTDFDGLIGDWVDRIPWEGGVWNVIDSDHFGISVVKVVGGGHELRVYVECWDDSTLFTADLGSNEILAAATRPSQAGASLLDRRYQWTVSDGDDFSGRIHDHHSFEWGGRGW